MVVKMLRISALITYALMRTAALNHVGQSELHICTFAPFSPPQLTIDRRAQVHIAVTAFRRP